MDARRRQGRFGTEYVFCETNPISCGRRGQEKKIHHGDTESTEVFGCASRTRPSPCPSCLRGESLWMLETDRAAGDEICLLRNEPNFARQARISLRPFRYCTRLSSAPLR